MEEAGLLVFVKVAMLKCKNTLLLVKVLHSNDHISESTKEHILKVTQKVVMIQNGTFQKNVL